MQTLYLPNDYVYKNSEQANEETQICSRWTCIAANGLRYCGHLIFLSVGGGRNGWALPQQRMYWTEHGMVYMDGGYVR